MNSPTKLSSKGQVVLPKDVRDALGWPVGQALNVRLAGGRAILEPMSPQSERISYAEFRNRVPKYTGKPITVEEMHEGIAKMFRERGDI